MKKYLPLAGWIFVFEVVSALIGQATRAEVDGWYQALTKPPLNPPDWIFPIMWTILYALIAAAGWSVWRERAQPKAQPLLILFAAYMALNWSWSFVFFNAHQMLLGFIWIVALNLIAVVFILKAWDRVRIAAYLMIPPLMWTLFASYLNGGVYILN